MYVSSYGWWIVLQSFWSKLLLDTVALIHCSEVRKTSSAQSVDMRELCVLSLIVFGVGNIYSSSYEFMVGPYTRFKKNNNNKTYNIALYNKHCINTESSLIPMYTLYISCVCNCYCSNHVYLFNVYIYFYMLQFCKFHSRVFFFCDTFTTFLFSFHVHFCTCQNWRLYI